MAQKVCKPPSTLSRTGKYCVCSPKTSNPIGYTINPNTGNHIKIKNLKDGCPPGEKLIHGAGRWEGYSDLGNKCFNPRVDVCMPPVAISGGNDKMKLPTWSIPRGETCPGKTPLCDKYCYANKAELMRSKHDGSVLASRRRNLYSSMQPDFVKNMVKVIKDKGHPYFRIHESGDFYNKAYRNKWYEIIRQCPEVKFLAYTKMCSWDWKNKPRNLNVFCSIWPDSTPAQKKSSLPKAYCIDAGGMKIPQYNYENDGLLCPEQTYDKDNDEFHASCDKCKYCWEEQKPVLFELH